MSNIATLEIRGDGHPIPGVVAQPVRFEVDWTANGAEVRSESDVEWAIPRMAWWRPRRRWLVDTCAILWDGKAVFVARLAHAEMLAEGDTFVIRAGDVVMSVPRTDLLR